MYDVCIIGGGINGVSTALQCSERGYSVILFEQKYLGSGASSKTSKLAHGGLRYLQNLEINLVRESLRERDRLMEDYPDLVAPLPFVFPVYNTFDIIKVWAGLKLYDILARGSQMPSSQKIGTEHIKLKTPWLKCDNITSAFLYYDAVMYDQEIVTRIANKARDISAELYSEEKVIYHHQTKRCVDVRTTKRKIECKVLVNVTGAWNKKMTTPSKGVHLITRKLKSDAATILINPKDSRVFFTIPYKHSNQTIIGTTDNTYTGDPCNVSISNDDRQYIIDAINTFSIETITMSDIVGEYVGLRPLAKSGKKVGEISRDFLINQTDRIFSMVGGKYTTHRAMCEQLTDQIARFLA